MRKNASRISDAKIKNEIIRNADSTISKNPYAALQSEISHTRADKEMLIRSFIDRMRSTSESSDKKLITARALHDLAELQFSRKKYLDCMHIASSIISSYPDYGESSAVLLLSAKADTFLRKRISPSLVHFLQKNTDAALSTDLENFVYLFFTQNLNPATSIRIIDAELKNGKFPGEIEIPLKTALARLMYDLKRAADSLAYLNSFLTSVQPKSPMYIRGWKLSSELNEKFNNEQSSTDARLRYGAAYTRESGVDLNENDFKNIIQITDRGINKSLSTARNISIKIQDAEEKSILIPANIFHYSNIPINESDRSELVELCRDGSPRRRAFASSG